MNEILSESVPKNWYKIVSWLAAFICIGLAGYGIYLTFSSPTNLEKLLSGDLITIVIFLSSIYLTVFGFFIAPYVSKKKIIFSSDGVTQNGLFSKQIMYQDIKKVTALKGHIEISGEGLFNKISFGNLYQNFDASVESLAANISGRSEIELKGPDKYLKKYLDAA